MFASGKPVWYLPFAILTVVFFFYASSGLWIDGWRSVGVKTEYPDSLTAIFTPETIDMLYKDARLHDALISLTTAIAETSSNVGDRYGFQNIKDFGQSLNEVTAHVRNTQQSGNHKRGFFDLIQNAFGGGGGRNSSGVGLSGLLGINVTAGIGGIFSSLGSQVAVSLTTPALFLGIGVGVGASTGLNLTDQKSAMRQASSIASAYNATPTGINLAVQNLGSGLTEQIASAVGGSMGSGGIMGAVGNLPIGSAAFALASGIGSGVSSGLNLTDKRFLPSNGSSIEAIAGNLGFGVTNPIASSIDISGLVKSVMMAGAGTGGGMLAGMLPQIASAAGTGLGEGAKKGFGLGGSITATPKMQKRQGKAGNAQPTQPAMMQMIDLPKTVGMFTEGLSESFLTGVDLTKVMAGLNLTGNGGLMGALGTANIQALIPALAAGAGSGIGLGASIGLQFTASDTTPTIAKSSMGNFSASDMNAANAAEGFTQNLVANFLTNSTVLASLMEMLKSNQPEALKGGKFAMVAEGFARGAVEGVLNGMSSVGGVQNLIRGDFPANAIMNVPVLGRSLFDDSVNGTAISFARGLTGEGAILAAQVVRNITENFNLIPTGKRKRSLNAGVDEFGVVPYNTLSTRQSQDQGNGSASLAISEGTLSMSGQIAIDTLTCSGVGGIASVGLGILNSGKVKVSVMDLVKNMNAPLDPKVLAMLPTGPVTVTSGGNRYTIVLRDATVSINGLGVIPFGVLTALHILLASIGFLIFLPLYLIFGVAWRLSVIAGHPLNEAKNRRFRMWFLITFFFTGVPGIVLGIVGLGNAKHFTSAHAIVGLILLILSVPAFIVTIIRLRTEIPHPLPSAFVGIQGFKLIKTNQRIYLISSLLLQTLLSLSQLQALNGFQDLRAVSICVVDAVLTAPLVSAIIATLLMVQLTAMGLVGTRQWLEQHIAKREIAAEKVRQETDGNEKSSFASVETVINRRSAPAPLDLNNLRTPLLQPPQTTPRRSSRRFSFKSPLSIRKENPFVDENQIRSERSRGGDNGPYSSISPRNEGQQSGQRSRLYPSDSLKPSEDYYNASMPYTSTLPNYGATSTTNSSNARMRLEGTRASRELMRGSIFENMEYRDEGGVKGFTLERKESVYENPRKAPRTPLPLQSKTNSIISDGFSVQTEKEKSFSRPFDGGDSANNNLEASLRKR